MSHRLLLLSSLICVSLLSGVFGYSIASQRTISPEPPIVHEERGSWEEISRPVIADLPLIAFPDEMGANPESTEEIRSITRKEAYRIDTSSSETGVLINLPTFFEQTLEQKKQFESRMQGIGAYTLQIQVFGYSQMPITEIRKFYELIQPSFSSFSISFYDIPVNYYDLILGNPYNLAGKELDIEFIGAMIPDGFTMENMLTHLMSSFHKTLAVGDTLDHLRIGLYESGNSVFRLTDMGIQLLTHLPTKQLSTHRILLDTRAYAPDEKKVGVEKLNTIFHESPIPSLEIDGVGKKQNAVISLQ